MKIDAWIKTLILGQVCRADFENDSPLLRAVLKMVPVEIARRKTGTVANSKNFFTAAGNEHHLSLKYIDEFFCQRVPVTLAGSSTRLKLKKIDAERFQTSRLTEATA